MATLVVITNTEQDIVSTKSWSTEMTRQGKFFLSTNAGAFRLLVPTMLQGEAAPADSEQQRSTSAGQ